MRSSATRQTVGRPPERGWRHRVCHHGRSATAIRLRCGRVRRTCVRGSCSPRGVWPEHHRPPPPRQQKEPLVPTNTSRPDRRRAAPPHRAAPTARPAPAPAASRTATATAPDDRSFADLGVPARLITALADDGITAPFPIQSATLPDSLAGRDVLGRGRTGSGKTVAFAVPLVVGLVRSGRRTRPSHPRALVLLPTRELASQVADVLRPLAATCRLSVATIFGGVNQNPQARALRDGVDIVVACPGRLDDLIGQRLCHLDDVEVTVLDEADHMADLGFLPVVKRILDRTPEKGQRLLFSATLDNGVDTIVRRYLSNPVTHSVDDIDAPAPAMTHHVLEVSAADKAGVVRALAAGQGRSLLFTRTKHQAKKLAKTLTASGIPAVDLHGNLSQPTRERNLAAFADGSSRVLVATDIAARGIHVDDIALVVHVDPPLEHKAYLHRSGRTARAGAAGDVVTVMTPDQAGDVRLLTRKAGIQPITTRVTPNDERIVALTGPPAAFVEPTPIAVVAPQRARSSR
ncbi:MAG: DEAD/DEAH box helicase, partial [Acidimicrobiia bacterium]|nr:DEAD/DEAH box helicase [Acidimicrobiia bacterium]